MAARAKMTMRWAQNIYVGENKAYRSITNLCPPFSYRHQTVRERWAGPKQLGGDRLERKEVRQVGSHGKNRGLLQETGTDGREVSRPYAQQSTKKTDDDHDVDVNFSTPPSCLPTIDFFVL